MAVYPWQRSTFGSCNRCTVATLSIHLQYSLYSYTDIRSQVPWAGLHLQLKAFCLLARAGSPVRDINQSHLNGTPPGPFGQAFAVLCTRLIVQSRGVDPRNFKGGVNPIARMSGMLTVAGPSSTEVLLRGLEQA